MMQKTGIRSSRKLVTLGLILNFLFCCATSSLQASELASLKTDSGKTYLVTKFGNIDSERDYFVNLNSKFVPIEDIAEIAKISYNRHQFGYLVVLNDGTFAKGRQGLLFYEKVNFEDPATHETKSGFVPVMNGRGQKGFEFVAVDKHSGNHKVFEIANPAQINLISMAGGVQKTSLTRNSRPGNAD
jgi:hypothetical protein